MTKAITLQNTTRVCLVSIVITYDGATSSPLEQVSYVVKDAGGLNYKSGSVSIALTGPQKTTLLTHIDSVILPAIDSAEGL